ncbi:MAG: chorismate synthase [Chloroflexia bacterium]
MIRFLTAGESHGSCLIGVIEGLPAGLPVDVAAIDAELARRQRGYGRGVRMEIERDQVEVLSGVIDGRTTGAPIALRIVNRDGEDWRERMSPRDRPRWTIPRPGHADYAGMFKYGLEDAWPVRERASARETAMRVAIGALLRPLLARFHITVGSLVTQIGGVGASFSEEVTEALLEHAEANDLRCPDADATARMREAIDAATVAGDTLGGVFWVVALGVPVGLGSHVHWERRLDARLAAAVMSIPGVKGIEIGPAFENARLAGNQVHDALFPDGKGGVRRETNRAGGIEGGISNGEPIVVRAAMKPLPSTRRALPSVDLATGEASVPPYQRADVCAVPAAAVVGEAMVCWVLAEALVEKYGGDSLAEMLRCATS